ncbi:MAG: prolyl oligopeptidase family serine peptidase [Cyanophyceae cyanobacterium]
MPTASYGSWKSPIASDLIVSETIRLGGVTVDGKDLYWLEGRPTEGGRNVLVRRSPEGQTDVTPAPFNVRTKVHEYGGAAYVVSDRTRYFVNFVDQRLYKQPLNSQPEPLTDESPRRYADAVVDRSRERLICVCEDHTNAEQEPENTLATVDLKTGAVTVLVSGSDFYSSPRMSPDGTQLAWLSWNHPHMPWDSTQLWVATVKADGTLAEKQCIAGGVDESVCEPQWSPDGKLYFSSDHTGWWNLYRLGDQGAELLYEIEAEFGYPHWVFGISTYAFASAAEIICTYTQNGCWHLARLNIQTKQLAPIDVPYTSIASLCCRHGQAIFIGGAPTQPTAVVSLDLASNRLEILKSSAQIQVDAAYLSSPEAIAFSTANDLTAYAWFYPPTNPDYTAPEGTLPPLIVRSHGGPTAAAEATLSWKIQYWTSRGFAYVDVNYGGSTGYGRAYRQRLHQQWGIVDIDDCVNAAKYLVRQGRVDGEKLAIAGSSAGGYTTLAALTFRDTFKAGASYYGVSDLKILAQETHKFESRYLDGLVGAYPQEKAVYEARSPIHFTHRLNCPVIFFQGLEDRVVPPNQAEIMFAALKAKGLPVAYLGFEGEQHGFRRAETIKRSLDAELYFYSRVFGFPRSDVEPVEIINRSED